MPDQNVRVLNGEGAAEERGDPRELIKQQETDLITRLAGYHSRLTLRKADELRGQVYRFPC